MRAVDFDNLVTGVAKKLADEGKLIEAGWVGLRAAVVNVNKALEERVLRQFDAMRENKGFDQRMVSLAVTGVQEAFMWANRAVFQPTRIALPEDEQQSAA